LKVKTNCPRHQTNLAVSQHALGLSVPVEDLDGVCALVAHNDVIGEAIDRHADRELDIRASRTADHLDVWVCAHTWNRVGD
jgi:hypothetical protein